MFENKYNSETNTNEAEYVPVPEIEKRKSGSKGSRKILKSIAALCCVAAVSAGSVTGYRYFTNKNENINIKEIASDPSEDQPIPLTDENAEYETSSLFQLSKSENALTTQEIYEKVLPSVVGVTSTFTYKTQTQSNPFFGYGGETTSKEAVGTGTGIIMSADGYIVTNAHVIYSSQISSKASNVKVLLSNKEEYEADIIGYDTQTDIAVLKVNDAPALTAAEFGDSSALNVGDSAIAIGNPLGFDLFGTLTVGYISGLNREIAMDDTIMHLIQTDAAINSGNSGGPLVNDRGQVIGINSMKMSSSYSSSEATIEGLGFAIPINEAQEIVNDLMNNGYVKGRPQLGITCQDISSSQYSSAGGIYVYSVNENGAADKAGIMAGDIIVAANGKAVSSVTELNQIKNQFRAGDTLKITALRENKYTEFEVVLEETAAATEEDIASEDPQTEEPQTEEPQDNTPNYIPDDVPQQGRQEYGYDDFFRDFGFDFPF